jgi:hypothetical protein
MVRLLIVAASTAAGLVAFAIQLAIINGVLPPPNQRAVWQDEIQLKVTAFGACVTFFTALYAFTKQFYPYPRSSTQYIEFDLATSAHLALLRATSIGCVLFPALAGFWPNWIAWPTAFLAVMLMPLALLDAYRAWRNEKVYYRERIRPSPR